MEINEFDIVKLTDGREGTIVEIYEEQGKPVAYEVEITGLQMELTTVYASDIIESKSGYPNKINSRVSSKGTTKVTTQ